MWSRSQKLWWTLLQLAPQGDKSNHKRFEPGLLSSIHRFCRGFSFTTNYATWKQFPDVESVILRRKIHAWIMTWRFYGICSTLLTLKWFTHKSAPICLNHFCLKMRKLLHLFQQRIVYLCFHIHKYDGNIFMLKFMLGMPKINEHPIHFGANH